MIEHPDESRIESRAQLAPEEMAAGSDDPHRQAEIILEDSDARTEDPEQTLHDSSQTPDRSDQLPEHEAHPADGPAG
ncbi:MAG TPA: hypothetical protein VF557_02990 [Jatrophihabitans sp.]|jgi:hypothetical protein|uniref:hypothetical protein n=1 Tax=Jatrophihabitans sp. TaxID=1932789 RepID=UPI002F1FC50C